MAGLQQLLQLLEMVAWVMQFALAQAGWHWGMLVPLPLAAVAEAESAAVHQAGLKLALSPVPAAVAAAAAAPELLLCWGHAAGTAAAAALQSPFQAVAQMLQPFAVVAAG